MTDAAPCTITSYRSLTHTQPKENIVPLYGVFGLVPGNIRESISYNISFV